MLCFSEGDSAGITHMESDDPDDLLLAVLAISTHVGHQAAGPDEYRDYLRQVSEGREPGDDSNVLFGAAAPGSGVRVSRYLSW
jgi:hypothetical protein